MTAEGSARTDHVREQKVLVSAASKHGATAEIGQVIAEQLAGHGVRTVVLPPGEVGAVGDYDDVVVGSAVYTGHWLDEAKDLAPGVPGLEGDFRDWADIRQWAYSIARQLASPALR
jgi:menaquinone-dependent protoporphyrinogen IX oxidase